MNPESCRKYLEDPEANAAHLAQCESCRALTDVLSEDMSPVLGPRSSVDMPVAPWEGASYRAWPLVLASVVVVGLLVVFVFAATGTSPLSLIPAVPSAAVVISMLRHFGAAAPGVVAVLFIVVNVLFVALLRRAPRGIDV